MSSPLFPKGGVGTDARRLQEAAQELATKVIDSGQFVQRGAIDKLIRAQPTGIASAAAFGALNRVLAAGNALVKLPRIEPKWIGVPLQIAKLTTVGLMHVLPSGKTADGSRAPLMDGTGYRTCGTPGLYTFVTDGFDWYSQGAETYRLFDVRLFGASPAATAAANTVAFQAAVNAANAVYQSTGAVQTVWVPGFRFALMPSATKSWDMPLLGSTTEVHLAVELKSGVIIQGEPGSEIVGVAPAGANSAWYYALFGTQLNMAVTDLIRVSIRSINFDFTDSYWASVNFIIYGAIVVGVTDFEMNDCSAINTGTVRLGRLARVMNCENVRLLNVHIERISQGFYVNYINGLELTGFGDEFGEFLDIDSPCQNVYCNVRAINGFGAEGGQVYDIASVVNGQFYAQVESVGNIAIIYQKPDSYSSFADWVRDFQLDIPAVDPVMCRNIVLDVTGKDIHNPDFRAIQVSLNREDPPTPNYWDGKGIMKNITVRALLEDSDPILVYECDGIDLQASLKNVTCGAGERFNDAAVVLRQSRAGTPLTESKLSGRAIITVEDSDRLGVRVIIPTDFHLEATVNGYNSRQNNASAQNTGVYIEGLGRKSGNFSFANLRVGGGVLSVASGLDPVDLRFSWDSSGISSGIWAHDMGGHRLSSSGTQVCRMDTPALFQGQRVFPIPSFDSRLGDYDIPIGLVTAPKARLVSADIVNQNGITAIASGVTRLSIRSIRGGFTSSAIGSASGYDVSNIAAGTVTPIGVEGSDVDGALFNGDTLALRITKDGNGSSQTGLFLRYALLEHGY